MSPPTDDRVDSAIAEYLRGVEGGSPFDVSAWLARHPDLADELKAFLGDAAAFGGLADRLSPAAGPADEQTTTAIPAREAPDADRSGLVFGDYQLLEWIADGGMGVVYRARQRGFDRDVAVKMLRPPFADDPGARRRFVREAAVSARLQHPGIPPVFEVGELPDGSPFLAMKLIRGRTLADILASAPVDTSRLLPAFELVCQAIGYAHAHGIVHRDIKPSNVMVGEFGEVQLMDWGLARELRGEALAPEADAPAGAIPESRSSCSTETAPGTIVGTPAYMAPEQARGESSDIRADVFGLGGLLCAILTGHPPHTGSNRAEYVRAAAGGDLGGAFARLDASGADPELVDLAKACLAPDVADRPRDGAAVADAVAAYRTGLEDRVRAAEAARAAAAARAEEEANTRREAEAKAKAQRKQRRAEFTLAAVVLVVTVVGGIGAWAYQKAAADRRLAELERERQEDRGRAGATAALDQLPQFWELALWKQADDALDQAEELLGPDGDPELRARLAAARRDTALVRRLDDIKLECGMSVVNADGTRPASTVRTRGELAERYRSAFADNGFDVRGGDAGEIARRLTGSGAAKHLFAALDDWTMANGGRDDALRFLALTPAVPGRGWRESLIKAWDDPHRLAEVWAGATRAESTATLRIAVAYQLDRLGGDGVRVLEAGLREHPNDFWLHFALGGSIGGPGRARDRVAACRAAVALRPHSAAACSHLGVALRAAGAMDEAVHWYHEAIRLDAAFAPAHMNLGAALYVRGDLVGAERCCREAVRLDPTLGAAHYNLGVVLDAKKERSAAADSFRKAVEADPTSARAQLNLGVSLKEQGHADKAAACFREAARLDPTFALPHLNLGLLHLGRGEAGPAESEFRTAIRLDPGLTRARVALGILLADTGNPDGAERCFRDAVRMDPTSARAHAALAGWHFSRGDLTEAAACSREAIRLDPTHANGHYNLGRVLQVQGDAQKAIASLTEAARLDPNDDSILNSLGGAFATRGEYERALELYREALRMRPKYPQARLNAALALRALGDFEKAAAEAREAIRLSPEYAEAWCSLGHALRELGEFAAAAEAMAKGHALGSKRKGWNYPSPAWLARCERLVGREKTFAAVRDGAPFPDAPDLIDLAWIAARPNRKEYALAVRLYTAAFAADPKTVPPNRQNVARAAVLCAAGLDPSHPVGAEEGSDLQRRAREWLCADLEEIRPFTRSANPAERRKAFEVLAVWLRTPDFVAVRDPARRAAMPADARAAWGAFWADVEALKAVAFRGQ